jgi:hypothetical protein
VNVLDCLTNFSRTGDSVRQQIVHELLINYALPEILKVFVKIEIIWEGS